VCDNQIRCADLIVAHCAHSIFRKSRKSIATRLFYISVATWAKGVAAPQTALIDSILQRFAQSDVKHEHIVGVGDECGKD